LIGGRSGAHVRLCPRLVAPFAVAAASLAAAGTLYEAVAPAVATAPIWHVSRAPKLGVEVAAGCPKSVRGYQDVVNTYPGPPLAPAGAISGLICRYRPTLAANGGGLARQTRLGEAQANELLGAVRGLDLAAPKGVMACPADFGATVLIGFSYANRPDVGLWYDASGCQSVDNGRLGSFEPGNPSFYNTFLTVVDRLSPPVPMTASFARSVSVPPPRPLPSPPAPSYRVRLVPLQKASGAWRAA